MNIKARQIHLGWRVVEILLRADQKYSFSHQQGQIAFWSIIFFHKSLTLI